MARITNLQSAIDYIRSALSGPWPEGVSLTAIAVPKEVRDRIIDEMGIGPITITRAMLKLYDDQAPTEVKVLGVLIKEDEPCTAA